jgi:hypothetical protein
MVTMGDSAPVGREHADTREESKNKNIWKIRYNKNGESRKN